MGCRSAGRGGAWHARGSRLLCLEGQGAGLHTQGSWFAQQGARLHAQGSWFAHCEGRETPRTLRGTGLHTGRARRCLARSGELVCTLEGQGAGLHTQGSWFAQQGARLHAQGSWFAHWEGREMPYTLRGAGLHSKELACTLRGAKLHARRVRSRLARSGEPARVLTRQGAA